MHITDSELVRKISHKDEKAFCELINRYGGLIKSIVRFHLKNLSMWQDDCTNEILLGIWQNIRHYDESKNSLKNWIAAVSKYKCIDFKRKHIKELNFSEIDENIIDVNDVLNETRYELISEIESLLSELSDSDKDIFVRRFILGQAINEIADETGQSASCIYTRISRNRTKLKKKFGR